jgi:hypothetical protein
LVLCVQAVISQRGQVLAGTTLADTAGGTSIFDATRHLKNIRYVSEYGWLYFRVAAAAPGEAASGGTLGQPARQVKVACARHGLVATRDGRVAATAVVRL